jgi:hypothetical protein
VLLFTRLEWTWRHKSDSFRSLLSDMPWVTFRVVGDLAICCNFGKPDPAHMKDCILKAGCITAGEELFGLGRIAPSAKGPGQREPDVEQTVFAADRTVTASARRDFRGI